MRILHITNFALILSFSLAVNSARAFDTNALLEKEAALSIQLQPLLDQLGEHMEGEGNKVINNPSYMPDNDNPVLHQQVVQLVSKIIRFREQAVNQAASHTTRPACDKSAAEYKQKSLSAFKDAFSRYQALPLERRIFAFAPLVAATSVDGAAFINPMYVCGEDYVDLKSLLAQ